MTDPADLRRRLDAARDALLARDAGRLERQLAQAGRGRFDPARFLREIAEGLARFEARAALRPVAIRYPDDLPVVQAKSSLLDAIREHQVVVVCGETGSGKTTQLPKLCLEAGRGSRGLIGHTQPRRLAARSVAARIARELDVNLGDTVGFETRFDRRVSDRTLVKLMTDGILLAELQRDRELLAYDTLIVDEAHERSLNIDFILGWLKRLLPRRPDLKVIVTSATLDPEKLSSHFGGAPILQVEGRTYPVEVRYRDAGEDGDAEDSVADAIDDLWRGGRAAADTLVFLPGEREIHALQRSLAGRFPHAQVLPLYSRLPAAQQDRVFAAGGPPRIILSTNVAETSVTVPGIRFVVDTGTARVSRWSTRLGIQQLHIEPVSQAAAQQRAGRCGRVGPGICVRLYAEDDFAARPPFTDAEVLRSNLAGVILQLAALGLPDVDHFPWVDEPDSRQVSEGYRLLEMLGALDDDRRLTRLGRELARLPLDPRVARIALAGRDLPCRRDVFALAAALSVQDPHDVPPDAQDAARQQHAQWRHPRSDFLTLLGLWDRWQHWSATSSNRQLRRVCREHFVSFLRMEEWELVYRQIADMIGGDDDAKAAAPATVRSPQDLESVFVPLHQALLAGLVDHIGVKLPEKPEYQGPRGRRFRIFPGSKLAKKAPPWLMCATIVNTSQVFARTCAALDPQWLPQVAPHLVKRSAQSPEWNPQRGEVGCTEALTLFGLPLGNQTRHYGSIDPAGARAIFVLEALVRGDLPNKPAFLQHNLRLAEELREKEARLRRPDLLADEAQLEAFYDARLPAEVFTTTALRRWLQGAAQGRALRMTEADVLRPGANADISNRYPDRVDVDGHSLRVSYAHDPGADADGVSFHVPLPLLYVLPSAPFEWLVPGLLPARIEALIRTLPHAVRRFCTPAAEYAAALANSLDPGSGPLIPAICERFRSMTGVELRPDDFAPGKLDDHLKPRIVVEDAQGRRVAEGESLDALRAGNVDVARRSIAASASADEEAKRWVRDRVQDWDFGDLPDEVRLAGGARAWPALASGDGAVRLGLFESADAAAAAHADGVRDLLLSRMNDRLRDLARTAKAKLGLALIGSPIAPEALARAIAERAATASWPLAEIRTQAAYQDAQQRRGDFGRRAAAMLEDVCAWLASAAELRKRLRALGDAWPEARNDLTRQLDSLFEGDFVARIPDARWTRIAVYLKAAALRLDRLPNKPARDLELTAQIRKASERVPSSGHPARWILEEWRVALFAQELKAEGSPSQAKVESALAGTSTGTR